MTRPTTKEYGAYYQRYVDNVPDGELIDILKQTQAETQALIKTISEEKGNHAYAEGKWTIKELLIHIIDTERVMAYRALRIARQDKTPLVGFDENTYAIVTNAANRTVTNISEEFAAVRAATIQQFTYFTEEMMQQMGTASNQPVSPRGLVFIIIGHEIHHRRILKERYLN